MKNSHILFLLLVATLPLGALEVGTFFDIGNMSFPGEPLSTTAFPSKDYPWGLSLEGKQEVNEGMNINFGYTRDRIINHLVYSTFVYKNEFLKIGAGPSFGVFNSDENPFQPGIATTFRLSWPGKLFLSFDMLSSIGFRLSSEGDYSQLTNNLTVGFYVPNAICTLGMDQKAYTKVIPSYEATDRQTDFFFKAEVFEKNVPLRALVGLIYRLHNKEYIKNLIIGKDVDNLSLTSKSITESLTTILLQTQITFILTDFLTFVVDAHTNLYAFGKITNEIADTKDLMDIPSTLPKSFLFEVKAGFSLNIDALGKK